MKFAFPIVLTVITFAGDSLISSGALVPIQDDSETLIAPDLFQFAPKSLEEAVDFAGITAGLGRPEDARAFLRHLLQEEPTDAELIRLREAVGAAVFVDFHANQRLQPEAGELLARINQASRNATVSDVQIQEAIAGLSNSGDSARSAVATLMSVGDAAVPAMLAVDPNTTAGRLVSELLDSEVRRFREGLISGLDSAPEATANVILGHLAGARDSEVAVRLLKWRWNPDSPESVQNSANTTIQVLSPELGQLRNPVEAAEVLKREARDLIRRAGHRFASVDTSFPDLEPDNGIGNRQKAVMQFVDDAQVIYPDDPALPPLRLVANLSMIRIPMSQPSVVPPDTTPDEFLEALQISQELGNSAATTELLKGLMDQDLDLFPREPLEAVLRKALVSTDPRTRLLTAVMVRDRMPLESSAPAVNRILGSVEQGSLRPEVVVAGFDKDQSRTLQVLFEDAGLAVTVSVDGIRGFEAAAGQMNCELFVLNSECWHWPLATTLANLRADIRTQLVPVVVIGPSRREPQVRRLAGIYNGLRFLSGPIGAETLQSAAEKTEYPRELLDALQRRNDLWKITLQQLDLPPVLLTDEDRRAAAQLVEMQQRP